MIRKPVTVRVESFQGLLRLRWSYEGKRRVISLGLRDTSTHRKVAEGRAGQIERDIADGTYDRTLKKYKGESASSKGCEITVVVLFDRFMQHRGKRVKKRTAERYSAVTVKLARFFKTRSAEIDSETAEQFGIWLRESLSPSTQRGYLTLIKACWEWGISENLVAANPWGDVLRSVKVPKTQRPKPFTVAEIDKIIEGFKGHRHYRRYTDFAVFLLGTGVRTGEAIGLRWGHLSDDCGKVWIGESVSRGARGGTKTNDDRDFKVMPKVQAMLLKRRPEGWNPDDLVFPSARGGAIDDRSFRVRAWTKILEQVGVDYRSPYKTRHTFISHMLEKRFHPMKIARMTGHNPQILFKHYASDIDDGLPMLDLF
jgi:integrase